MFRSFIRLTLGLGMLALTSGAGAQVDLLKLPAQPSVLATRSLLLDVQRVGQSLYAVGEFGQVLHSADNGKSWQAGKVPVSVTLTAVAFESPTEGYAVGHDGVVLHTTDSGLTWTKVLDGASINEFAAKALQERADRLQAELDALGPRDEARKKTLEQIVDDASFAADSAKADIKVGPSKPLLDVKTLGQAGSVMVAGAYGQLLRSQDHGKTWEYLGTRIDNPNGYHLNTLMVADNGDVWVAGEQGGAFVSHDKGSTWESRKIDYKGSIFALTENPATHSVLAFGLRGHAFKLGAAQSDWQPIETGLKETLSAATVMKDGTIVVAGARGVLMKSSDDFATFQVTRRADKLPSGGIVQLADGQVLLTGLGGFKSLSLSEFK